jgi:pyruvate dehydrogenase E1 component
MADAPDVDPEETREWLEAFDSVLENEGRERAHDLIERLIDRARRSGVHLPHKATTAYVNTIRKADEPRMPGEPGLEYRVRSMVRWNALAMVMRANLTAKELGGHIATFASAATLYDVGFSTSRATAPPASTRAPSWKGGSPRSSCSASGARSTAAASPPIRTRG